ncbi:hypothetical protein BDY19DRAFT_328618 [Irpex rosettiformis]|uniref:Uncharacterized protein n=1 Tax=Irpex rosettiformis TaxID=378272 RepID=A0ACB8TXQ8_9APHY|nr:hypothetical protein BDY19DRAFT_328618 [Irpex rosettiformis]
MRLGLQSSESCTNRRQNHFLPWSHYGGAILCFERSTNLRRGCVNKHKQDDRHVRRDRSGRSVPPTSQTSPQLIQEPVAMSKENKGVRMSKCEVNEVFKATKILLVALLSVGCYVRYLRHYTGNDRGMVWTSTYLQLPDSGESDPNLHEQVIKGTNYTNRLRLPSGHISRLYLASMALRRTASHNLPIPTLTNMIIGCAGRNSCPPASVHDDATV